MAKERITPISESDCNAVKRKTAAALPDSPADYGMRAGAVKPKFWQALIKGDDSIAGLLNRVIGEINAALEESDREYGGCVTGITYDKDRCSLTVTFGDGTTRNLDEDLRGNGIADIQKTATRELVDTYTFYLTNGDTETFTVTTGRQGEQGEKGERGDKGDRGEQGAQGIQGVQGERGEGFSISRVYASVAEMEAGFHTDGVEVGQFVLISTGNVEDEENARLYVKGAEAYSFLCDLSGAQGIRGPIGPQGIQGEQGIQGIQGVSGVYIGSGEMPDGYNVQIDPGGTPTDIVALVLASMPDGDEVSY